MAYEDKKSRFEILDVVRVQDHNKADQIAPGAAFAVTVPTDKQVDLLTVFKNASAPKIRQIFSAIVQPVDNRDGEPSAPLIKPKNVIAIMHQGQGGILNSKNPNFHAHVFDKEVSRKNEDTSHIVSKRTFVPKRKANRLSEIQIPFSARTKHFQAFPVTTPEFNESAVHKVLICKGKLSEFFQTASEDDLKSFRSKFVHIIENAGKGNNGQVRIVIEDDRYIHAYSGENLSQEMKVLEDKDGNEYLEGYRWFENPHLKKPEIS